MKTNVIQLNLVNMSLMLKVLFTEFFIIAGSSGLNTPLLEKSQSSAIQSSVVKRRLELAIGSINNDELKNRLKAIISGSKKGSLSGALSIPGRRTIKMKLRKKGVDNRLVRKTRHSDKVKEAKEKKTEETNKVSKGDEKVVPNNKEEKTDGDNQPAKKGSQKKGSNSAGGGKDKKLKDVDEQGKNSETSKSKSQKISSKPSGGKKSSVSSGVNGENTDGTTSTVSEVTPPAIVSKKKKKNPSHTNKKVPSEKSINGLIKVSKKKVSNDGKPSSSNSGDSKVIDVKKVLAKKILDKKKKSVPIVAQETVNDNVVVTVETDSLISSKETSVQKKPKQPGKSKQSKTANLKEKQTDKTKKKSKVIHSLKNKKEFVKTLLATGKSLKSNKTLTKKIQEPPPRTEANNDNAEALATASVPSKLPQKSKLKATQPKDKQAAPSGKTKALEQADTPVAAPAVKKKKYVPPSSSEEIDDSEDSEPEVIRNFRSGRSCTGRAGLRTKRRPILSRYSFRTCLETVKKETEVEEDLDEKVSEEQEVSRERKDPIIKADEFSDNEPISTKRKRKIANYENQDDCAYVPEENSSDSEDELYEVEEASEPIKSRQMPDRKIRRVTQISSKVEIQPNLTGENPKSSEVEATNVEGEIPSELPLPTQNETKTSTTTSKGKSKVKYIKKKIISSKVYKKKIPIKKDRPSKSKVSVVSAKESTDTVDGLKTTPENDSMSQTLTQAAIKSKGKKQKSKVSGTSVPEVSEAKAKSAVKKKKVMSVKNNADKTEMENKKVAAKTSKAKTSKPKNPLKNVVDSKQSVQSTVKKTSKKTLVKSQNGKDQTKLGSQVVQNESQDISAGQNVEKKPQKIKGRSSSISLGNLSRTDQTDNKAQKTIKKCSSMSSIPQNSREDLVEEPTKNKGLAGKSRTLSDPDITSDSATIPVSEDASATVSSIPQQLVNSIRTKGRQCVPGSVPNMPVTGAQTVKKSKGAPKKKSKVPVLDSLDDKSPTSQNVNVTDETVKVPQLPNPVLPKSCKDSKKKKILKTTGIKKTKKEVKKTKVTVDLQQEGSTQSEENIAAYPIRKRGRKRKVDNLSLVGETVETAVELKDVPSISGSLAIEPTSVSEEIPSNTVAVTKVKRKYTKRTDKQNVNMKNADEKDDLLPRESSAVPANFSSSSRELKASNTSKKRKLSVMETGGTEDVISTDHVVSSKKLKKHNISKAKVRSDLPKDLKNNTSSESNLLVNNHVINKKVNKSKISKIKEDSVVSKKSGSKNVVKHPKNIKDNKENRSGSDITPVLKTGVVPDVNEATNTSTGYDGKEDEGTPGSMRVKRRRSSVEKIKDIPTRSTVGVNLQENPAPSPDTVASDEKMVVNQVSEVLPAISAASKVGKKPQMRKRRTQSSHEIQLKDEPVRTANEGLISPASSSCKISKKKNESHSNTVDKKPVGRKRAASTSGLPKTEGHEGLASASEGLKIGQDFVPEQELVTSLTKQTENGQVDKIKKTSAKKKKTSSKKDTGDPKCLECGLRFDSVASLEDHRQDRQDCINIAFEMSLMEAEDHLYECQHCHLTFARKGTHRQHAASCRLGKYKGKHEGKARRRTSSRLTVNSQDLAVPVEAPTSGCCTSEEGLSKEWGSNCAEGELGVGGGVAGTPLDDRCSQDIPVVPESVSKLKDSPELGSVPSCSKSDSLQNISPSKLKRSPKCRRRLRTNGKVEHGDIAEPVRTNIASEEKCVVCGCEIRDEDMSNKHLLLEQFAHSCQQQPVLEVCVLLAYYNLSMETIRNLAGSAIFYQGSTVLKLDAKQQTSPDLDPCLSTSENNSASQLLQILASPHCMWVSSVLEAIAQQFYSVEAVSISGTRQDALRAVTFLEELFEEISNTDSTIRKNQMLRTMKETFEAGTL